MSGILANPPVVNTNPAQASAKKNNNDDDSLSDLEWKHLEKIAVCNNQANTCMYKFL